MALQRGPSVRHSRPQVVSLLTYVWALSGIALLPAIASAQATPTAPVNIVVHGEVLDSSTGFPVPGAFVELVSEDLRTIADSAGYFRFPAVTEGHHQVRVTQLGYVTLTEFAELLVDEVLTIWLTPRPFELEGITVTVNRLESRRRAFASAVRVLDAEDVQMSGAFDALELMERMPGVRTIPCGVDDCVLRRGRYVPLRVVVDEMQTFGGALALEGYPTSEIHSIEFVPSCAVVRVYTRQFIERMGRRGGRTFFGNLCALF